MAAAQPRGNLHEGETQRPSPSSRRRLLQVFTIYAMNRDDLEARMGVVVTLTLAISALQFT